MYRRALLLLLLAIFVQTACGPSVDEPNNQDQDLNASSDADSDKNTDADTDSDADSDGDADADTDSDADSDGDADSDADADGDTDADADSDGETDPLPEALDDALETPENTTLIIEFADLLDNDTPGVSLLALEDFELIDDLDLELSSGAFLTWTADDDELTYDPAHAFDSLSEGDTAEDVFDYTVVDEFGQLATATVTITVNGQNTAPTAVDHTLGTVETDLLTLPAPGLLEGAADIDTSDTLSLVAIDDQPGSPEPATLPSGALVTFSPDGAITYDPNGQFEALTEGESAEDVFTFTIADPHGGVSTATVSITIEGINNPPAPGLADALYLSACTRPGASDITLTSGWNEPVDLVIHIIDTTTDDIISQHPVSLAASGQASLTDLPFSYGPDHKIDVVYNLDFTLFSRTSDSIASCFAPGLSLSADCSTYQTSRYTLTNTNDVPVDYEFDYQEPGSNSYERIASTIPANSVDTIVNSYDESAYIYINDLLVDVASANTDALCPGIRENIHITSTCSNADFSRFDITNDNDEEIALQVDGNNSNYFIPANSTRTVQIPFENLTVFRLYGSYIDAIYPTNDSCNAPENIIGVGLCTSPHVAYISLTNNDTLTTYDVHVVAELISAIESETVTLFPGQITTVELPIPIDGIIGPGDPVYPVIESPDGHIAGPTFYLVDTPCF